MQKLLSTSKIPLLAFLVALAVLFFFYHQVLLSPNDYLFSPTGDGIKNYYSYLYHAKYDTNFSDFSGMNYPFYEHIVYTDAHPLLSWLVGKFGLVAYGIGILNFLMLISYPIAAFFIAKILRHYEVNKVWTVFAAVAITFMSPQVFRMTGHFSLSYVFAVPLMWWLLIKCFTGKKWLWSVITSIYLILFFFTHPYLGMILVFFSLVFWLVNMVIDRKRILVGLVHIFFQTIIPIITFQAYVFATDTHIDRVSTPAGFFQYYASWKSIIIPHDGPLSWIGKVFKINIGTWEGWAYIGFPTIVFAVIIGRTLFQRRKKIAIKPFLKKELILFLIASFLILMFSFCFPLKYSFLRWITDLLGPIKQFRVLGRFTWVFFYVFTVATIVGFHKLYKNSEKKKAYLIVFFIGILFYGLEFYPVHNLHSKKITLEKNTFKPENIDPNLQEVIDYVNTNNYDAIIFLPMQHMSSENIMLLGAEKANYDAFLTSYYTQVPLLNSISSRMSLTEAIKVNNYFSPNFMEKKLTYDIPKEDNIILIKNRDLLEPAELRMIWESDLIFENDEFMVFNFDQKKWNNRKAYDKVMAENEQSTIKQKQAWRSDTSNVWFYYENYDTLGLDLPLEKRLGGKGAFYGVRKGWVSILELTPEQIAPGNYIVKYWYYLREGRPDCLAVVEEFYGEDLDSNARIATIDIKQSTIIVAGWCLVEMEFTVLPTMNLLRFIVADYGSKDPFIVDELLIHKQNNSPLFRTTNHNGIDYVVYNNYWINSKSFE